MLSGKERTDLVNVARLYYEQGLTQDQVAKRIGVSRPLVSKMLTRAREAGIVHIEIRSSTEGDAALLEALQTRYALHGGMVLPVQDSIEENLKAAADYLSGELLYERNLGLGWGYPIKVTVWTNWQKRWPQLAAGMLIVLLYRLFRTVWKNGSSLKRLKLFWNWTLCGRNWMLLLLRSEIFPVFLMKQRRHVLVTV